MIRKRPTTLLPRRHHAQSPPARTGPLLLLAACVAFLGCEQSNSVSPGYRPKPSPTVATQHTPPAARFVVLPMITTVPVEPAVRVRVARSQARVDVSSAAGLVVGPPDGTTVNGRRYPTAVAVTLQGGSFIITDTSGHSVRWALPELGISPIAPGTPVVHNGKAYPGTITITPVIDARGRATGQIDVVNHVAMEAYLPGVVERELYGSWDPATFRAAAIAARSYAVFESSLNADRHYDLESTTASQAYGGRATNPTALAAVTRTRGMLLEHNGRVVPAFYSSTCGGTGQDAVAAFTWLRGLPDIQPLRGRNRGTYCSASAKYRWGPVTRSRSSLALRIGTWGQREQHPVGALRGIRDIRVAGTNRAGRPAAFAVTDERGVTHTLGPEQFRFACNASAPRLGAVPKGQTLYSSHVRVSVGPTSVSFYDGRGFGHGVGLCQFGAQALALSGYSEYSILEYYYPGSRVVRTYR
jgi:stage II sporulation protein D